MWWFRRLSSWSRSMSGLILVMIIACVCYPISLCAVYLFLCFKNILKKMKFFFLINTFDVFKSF
jgi:hypothetical protein